ncbi:MAG: hypothetical protein J6Y58_03610 [Clostridiales bacterium]|nr:hypothetical protein [Clostridiales bacterium]
MKRSIAVLLTAAMILSLAGCSKKNEKETSRTKRTKDTTETEETEAPGTEESSSESEQSTGSESESESSSDTSGLGKPSGSVPVELDHSLSLLLLSEDVTDRAYGELIKNLTYPNMMSVHEYVSSYSVLSDKYDALNKKLSDIHSIHKNACDKEYDELIKEFPEFQKIANEDNYYMFSSNYFGSYMNLCRADSSVTSFSVVDTLISTDLSSSSEAFYNLKSGTGEEIKFDDIVTDRSAFADAILASIPATDANTNNWLKTQYEAVKVAAENIRTNNDVAFLMYPNAIYISDTVMLDGQNKDIAFNVSVLDLPNCVKLEYFGATTKYYSIVQDVGNSFKWDFDGDGVLDTLTVNDVSDDDYGITLDITLNDKKMTLPDIPELQEADTIAQVWVSYTDSGYYLFVEGAMEDPVNLTYVFHINNDSIEHVGVMGEIKSFPVDPEHVIVMRRSDLLGTNHVDIPSTLIGFNGVPAQTSEFIGKYGLGVTNEKMVLGKFTPDGKPTNQSVTVPAGTTVRILGINTKQELVTFEAVFPDESKNFQFQMVLRNNDYDYDVYFNGKSAYELFKGANYYD